MPVSVAPVPVLLGRVGRGVGVDAQCRTNRSNSGVCCLFTASVVQPALLLRLKCCCCRLAARSCVLTTHCDCVHTYNVRVYNVRVLFAGKLFFVRDVGDSGPAPGLFQHQQPNDDFRRPVRVLLVSSAYVCVLRLFVVCLLRCLSAFEAQSS